MADDAVPASAAPNEDGDVSFIGIAPGLYTLAAERPMDFATSRVRCRTASGDALAARAASNQIALLLAAGDEITCSWYLVPAAAQDAMPADPTALPPAMTATAEGDSDADGLTDGLETALGTDPLLPDSDADGLSDSDEINFYGTDPLDLDTDGDGLDDAEELVIYGTNPLLDDTDGDNVSDYDEVVAGSDPLDVASVPATPTPIPTPTPEPTLEPTPEQTPVATPVLSATPLPAPDELEPLEPGQESGTRSLPPADLDNDGLTTADEVSIHGTNITVADSDGDGINDGDEVAAGTDPLDPSDD